MNDTTPTPIQPLPEQSLAWLRHAAAILGRAEPQALLHLLERVEALEVAAAPQPDKIDRLIALERAEDEAFFPVAPALSEPPELSFEEASILLGSSTEHWEVAVPRIHRAGWDAAMAAVKAQQQQPAAKATPAPAPPLPTTLVGHLAFLIASFASVVRVGDDATPTAIAAVRLVADWLNTGDRRFTGSAIDLRAEADSAAAELKERGHG